MNISPSILSANKDIIAEELSLAASSGAKYIHIDVMDGVFVPAYTFDHEYVEKIHTLHPMINDVHLMIDKPIDKVASYVSAGANILTFHLEACASKLEAHETIKLIHGLGCKAGISIKPATPASELDEFVGEVELLLVMSVEPGKGGQKFIPSALEKISYLKGKSLESPNHPLIEVDGGINAETAPLAAQAGVDILVAGSYLYGHDDFAARAKGLLEL